MKKPCSMQKKIESLRKKKNDSSDIQFFDKGEYPTFSDFAGYVYKNIRKAYDDIVAKIGMEPENPMDLDISKIAYDGSDSSLFAKIGDFSLHSYYGYPYGIYSFRFRNLENSGYYDQCLKLDYSKGYPLQVRIEIAPEFDYTSFVINKVNPKTSTYVDKGNMYRAISIKVFCPAFSDRYFPQYGDVYVQPDSSCLIGSTPDISKAAIKYNLPMLRKYKALLDPEKQKVTDLYVYRAYSDPGISMISVHRNYYYVRNVKNWDAADKKVLAHIKSAGVYDYLSRLGIIHGVSFVGDRVVAPDSFNQESVTFTGDVFEYSHYNNPVHTRDTIEYTQNEKTFKNVHNKFV